jgi:peptidoglycan/LPS O-acetylase OafA/YrhL
MDRVAELDSLRGLAALAVIVFHAQEAWLPFGWAAVDLFFVLSGYLITSIILRQAGTPGFLQSFYIRRGLRTWPIYYLLIAILIISSPVLPRRSDWGQLPISLTYAQGLARLWGGSSKPFSVYLDHTWSLAIEEQFYLIWPALVLTVGRGRVAILALVCAGGSILARGQGVWWDSMTRADGLALGGLLAAVRFRDQAPERLIGRPGLVLGTIRLGGGVALGMLAALGASLGLRPEGALSRHPALTLLLFNLVWLALIDVVLSNAGRRLFALLRLRPLRQLGVISYGLYLYHYPVLMLSLDLARDLGYRGKASYIRILGILLTIPLAALSWRFIERPLLGLKRSFAYGQGDDTAPGRYGRHVWSASAQNAPRRAARQQDPTFVECAPPSGMGRRSARRENRVKGPEHGGRHGNQQENHRQY